METEHFLSGYCRQLENGQVTEVDCCYGSCAYQGSCPIAQKIEELTP